MLDLLTNSGLMAAVVEGAAGMFVGAIGANVIAARRWYRAGESGARVRGGTSGVPAGPPRVRDPGPRVPSRETQAPACAGVTSAGGVRPPPGPACVQMGAKTQINEFVAWMLHWDYAGTFTHLETLAFYGSWAREGRVVTLPATIILDRLTSHPNVTRSRPRVKDKITGKVCKNAAGTPERITSYTFAAGAAVVLPAGVTLRQPAAGSRQPVVQTRAPVRRAA